ncbi:WD40/YVTN/BNR-like repeat-containing protein [Nocardioides taihuensis]|jgi:hypothetical protein|uniref:WD40/YVTN/BNR-like repeat-containing protein n=1 Tax=Nocardioides taihuensis TaxID=1835606 RepID=A0ABW0BCX0_9ACTN
MTEPADKRILGLSPRARRFVFPFLAIAAVIIAIGYFSSKGSDDSSGSGTGPVVGGDLHAVDDLGSRLFVGGHDGAGYRARVGGWTQIDTLEEKDVMGWAATGTMILAGGHAGLYASTDDGSTFGLVDGLPVADVHALGASGDVVYLASPETGTLVSTDGGKTFEPRSPAGQEFMGTIWVDRTDADVAVASSMREGAVRTTDGGASWTPLGSASGSMAVAVDKTGSRLLAIGMDGAQLSTDGGMSWAALDVPGGTSAGSYTSTGHLVVAALDGTRAILYKQDGSTWDPIT